APAPGGPTSTHAALRSGPAAIGPARGSCLPSMAGYHVLDIAELLTSQGTDPGARATAGPAAGTGVEAVVGAG
ncbi:ADP-ribosylglycohydrolase family protein, partial [Streptomyces nigrescens]